jgi:hypothetical protein
MMTLVALGRALDLMITILVPDLRGLWAPRDPTRRGTPSGPAGQSSAWPRMQVTVPPATQMVPSPSREMWTRPARPRAVPWLTT